MSIYVEVKDKYIVGRLRGFSYRSRTGPMCCNAGCASSRKKRAKMKAGKISSSRLAAMGRPATVKTGGKK